LAEIRNAYKVLIGKTEINQSAHRWDDNGKLDLSEIEWYGVEWSGRASSGYS
jgi:hypothetical protein